MDRKLLYFFLALFVFTFLLKAYYLDKVPFQFDETMYAEMIAEESEHITFLPTYFGMWAPWKPGLYFIVYSLFLPITSHLFTSLEWIYRSPNLLFGAINACLVYILIRRFLKPETALAAAVLFYSSCMAFYVEARLLMEVFALTPILLSLIFYTGKDMNPVQRFAGAALFAFLAALTKSVISLMIIPLALAFVFQNDRKNLLNPAFLLSLIAPVAGILIFAFSLSQIGMMGGVLFKDTGKFFVYNYLDLGENAKFLVSALATIIIFAGIYLVVAFRKMLSSWREEIFFSIWTLLLFVQVFSSQPMMWYFYYVAPALCFFAAYAMEEKGKFDRFSIFLFLLVFLFNIGMVLFAGPVPETPEVVYESKEIGLSLAGEENVLFAGYYFPLATALSYKTLSEREEYGEPLDFGYVLYEQPEDKSCPPNAEVVNSVVSGYNSQVCAFHENFASIFWSNTTFRKKTSITEFDYLVISPSNITISDARYSLQFNSTMTAVYKRR